jgi:hypothetical protein
MPVSLLFEEAVASVSSDADDGDRDEYRGQSVSVQFEHDPDPVLPAAVDDPPVCDGPAGVDRCARREDCEAERCRET